MLCEQARASPKRYGTVRCGTVAWSGGGDGVVVGVGLGTGDWDWACAVLTGERRARTGTVCITRTVTAKGLLALGLRFEYLQNTPLVSILADKGPSPPPEVPISRVMDTVRTATELLH